MTPSAVSKSTTNTTFALLSLLYFNNWVCLAARACFSPADPANMLCRGRESLCGDEICQVIRAAGSSCPHWLEADSSSTCPSHSPPLIFTPNSVGFACPPVPDDPSWGWWAYWQTDRKALFRVFVFTSPLIIHSVISPVLSFILSG